MMVAQAPVVPLVPLMLPSRMPSIEASLTLLPTDERNPPTTQPVEGARAISRDSDFWEMHQQLERLGRGCYGCVLRARVLSSGDHVAVKVVSSAPRDGEDASPLREPELLQAARHPHVISLLDIFQSPTTLFLVQEAACCDLLAYAARKPGQVLSEAECCKHCAGVLSALHHIHSLRIVHRDVKATNVLRTFDGDVRLADFGLATRLPDDGLLTSVCGTHDYLAPEMIRCGHGDLEGYGTSVDMWGAGLLLFSLLCGGNPFERDTDIATLQAILAGALDFPSEATISWSAQEFIRKLLTTDPDLRLTAKLALNEAWLEVGTRP